MLYLSSLIKILLLEYLLVYIYSYKIEEVIIGSLPEQYSDEKTNSISFNITISASLNFDFLTIKILNQLNRNQNKKNLGQTVFLSYSDRECQKERNQMSFSPYQDSIMILNMTEIKT